MPARRTAGIVQAPCHRISDPPGPSGLVRAPRHAIELVVIHNRAMDALGPDAAFSYAPAIRELLARRFGAAPIRLRHNWFGHGSVVHTAWIGDETVIVRANERAEAFVSTLRNIDVLRGLGIPVPKVLFSDLTMTDVPFAYIIAREIPGRDLRFELPTMSQEQQVAVASQIMDYEQRVAALPEGQGYGYVGIGEVGPHQDWRSVLGETRRPDGPTGLLHDRLAAAMVSIGRHLERVPPTCFLDDLTTKNVIVENGILQGVIDFDCVCYGDPLFHLGLAQTAVAFDLPESCLTYVEHLCDAGEVAGDRRRIVDIYSAHCGLDFLTRIREPAEYEAGLDKIEHWLDRSDA